MVETWLVAAAILSVGTIFYLSGRKKRRPTQHDLDPTLQKNQIRITTQKKAFRREDLPPEYLAQIERRDIVELPMGAARPQRPADPSTAAAGEDQNSWLPDNLKKTGSVKTTKRKNVKS